jgi:hypothetical protein
MLLCQNVVLSKCCFVKMSLCRNVAHRLLFPAADLSPEKLFMTRKKLIRVTVVGAHGGKKSLTKKSDCKGRKWLRQWHARSTTLLEKRIEEKDNTGKVWVA